MVASSTPEGLSAVIITYNEEKNIGRCLASLQGIADDIVVVDSYSKDATAAICAQFGARVVQHPFEGHIEQKNWAITQARYPHILSLDADEALSPTLQTSIKQLRHTGWQHEGYTMHRLTNYCGQWIRHSGWYPDTKLRLWDSRLGKWGGINPHDKYEMLPTARIGHLEGDLWHYSYYDENDHYQRAKKYAAIAAQQHLAQGKAATWWHIIVNPVAKFLKHYVIKAGFLDGKAGWAIAVISAKAAYWKYAEALRLKRKRKNQSSHT